MSNLKTNDVRNPDYSILTARNFFGATDPIRIVIIIYIFLSLILNSINFAVLLINVKRNKMKLPLATWLILGTLLMNFVHTATYFYEWVIKEGVDKVTTTVQSLIGKETKVHVGALLTGNPKNMIPCYLQGFFLIFSSVSQDFLINIFFYLIDAAEFNGFYVKMSIAIIGIAFPFFFTLVLQFIGAIGLNDEFCYVKKFEFAFKDGKIAYRYKGISFQICVMIVYFIRIINCIATTYFLIKIIKYVKSEKKPYLYLFKLIFIPTIQVFTIGIGVIYRFINLVDAGASVKLAGPYLILNTADGFLFPIGFALQNNIFSQLKLLITGKRIKGKSERPKQIEYIEKSKEETDSSRT